MAEKRNESFTVTDRRLFTADGELRKETSEEQEVAVSKPAAVSESATDKKAPTADQGASAAETTLSGQAPTSPSVAEQRVQADAYRESSAEMDRQVEAAGQSAKDLEITFERFLASLYMTGMLQLGLMQQQGEPPQLDLIGARQTIDSLSLLAEKTKGNLTSVEQNFLQNALYEMRMAYVEVTNAIAKGPQQVQAGPSLTGPSTK
jgi:hypothetical protein